jgi:hypothetical protein
MKINLVQLFSAAELKKSFNFEEFKQDQDEYSGTLKTKNGQMKITQPSEQQFTCALQYTAAKEPSKEQEVIKNVFEDFANVLYAAFGASGKAFVLENVTPPENTELAMKVLLEKGFTKIKYNNKYYKLNGDKVVQATDSASMLFQPAEKAIAPTPASITCTA